MLAVIVLASPALTQPADSEHEWIGTATWDEAGAWRGYDPGNPGPVVPLPHDAEPGGATPVFTIEGNPESEVTFAQPGLNHWEIHSLTFDREWDWDDDLLDYVDVGPGESYTITGNALYIGAGGITNLSDVTQTVANNIWLYDDLTVDGGSVRFNLGDAGGPSLIDTAFGVIDKNLTLTGARLYLYSEIRGAGQVTYDADATYIFTSSDHTSRSHLTGAAVILAQADGLGQHERVLVGGDADSVHIMGLNGPLTLAYDFELENDIAFGGDHHEMAPGVDPHPITLNGWLRVRDDTRQITTEHDMVLTFADTGGIALDVHGATIRTQGDALTSVLGAITGSGDLVQQGPGTLRLVGDNTYTGETHLHAGTLEIGGDNAFGNSPLVAVEGQMRLRAVGDVDVRSGTAFQLAADLDILDGGALALHGDVDLDDTVALTLFNTSGTTIAQGATLDLHGHELTVRGNEDLRVLGDVAGDADGHLIKEGAGTLSLLGPNSYEGDTILRGGVLELTGPASLGASPDLYVEGSAGLRAVGNANIDADVTLDADLTLLDGDALVFAGDVTAEEGALTLQNMAGNTVTGSLTLNDALTLQGPGDLSLTGSVDGGGSLIQTAAGTLVLGSANTYSGGTTLANGTTRVGDDDAFGSGTVRIDNDVQLAADTAVVLDNDFDLAGHLRLIDGEDLGFAGTLTTVSLMQPRITVTNSAANTIEADGELVLVVDLAIDVAGGTALTILGEISGDGGLVKTGAGTLAVGGTSSDYGATSVEAGVLEVLEDAELTTASLSIDAAAVDLIDGAALTVDGVVDIAGAGVLRLQEAAAVTAERITLDNAAFFELGEAASATVVDDVALATGSLLILMAGAALDADSMTVDMSLVDVLDGATVTTAEGLTVGDTSLLRVAGRVEGPVQLDAGASLHLATDAALTDVTDLFVEGAAQLASTTDVHATSDTRIHLRDSLTLANGGALTLDVQEIVVDAPATLFVSNQAETRLGPATTITLDENLTLNTAADLDVDGSFAGAGDLIKHGSATVRIHSDTSVFGNALVEAGTLHLLADAVIAVNALHVNNGVAFLDELATVNADDVVVGAGGSLRGHGQVNGDVVVETQGELRPINPNGDYGVMQIAGDAHWQADSLTTLRFGTPNQSDSVNVTGTATIDDGARLLLEKTGSAFIADGERFTLINAAAVDVNAGQIHLDVVIDSLFLRFDFVTEDTSLAVVASRDAYVNRAAGGNNRSLAAALDGMAASLESRPGGKHAAAIGALLAAVDDEDPAAFNEKLRNLSPSLYSGSAAAQVQTNHAFHADLHRAARLARASRGLFGTAQRAADAPRFAQAFDERGWSDRFRSDAASPVRVPSSVPEDRWTGFLTGYGVYDRLDSTSDRPGVRANTHGFIVGADYAFSHELAAGLSGGYGRTDLRFREGRGNGDVDSFRIGPHAVYAADRLVIDASLTYGFHDNKSFNRTTIAGISERKRANYNAHDVTLHLSSAYAFHFHEDRTTISPVTAVDYVFYHRESFTEDGGNVMNMTIDSENTQSLQSTLGLALAHRFLATPNFPIQPELFVGWSYEFLDDRPEVSGQFVGQDQRFTVRGPRAGRNALQVGVGITSHWDESSSTHIQYTGRFRSNENTQAISAGLTYRF
ncbi:MAG: autotransporter domain-containing protein [Phycisphaeraceae bacterium]